MGSRVLLSVLLLAIGVGCGFVACWFARPATATPATIPPAEPVATDDEEVIVEMRVKLPAGVLRSDKHPHTASGTRQGALLNTGQPLDLAIEGQGFFQLILPSGETVYTRDGAFGFNSSGVLVTRTGYRLTTEITIPQDAVSFSVGRDGTVSVTKAGMPNASDILGQLTLARFQNPGWLQRDERGWWVETAESGPPLIATPGLNGCGWVRQGFRERRAELDTQMLIDLVRAIVHEDETAQIRVVR